MKLKIVTPMRPVLDATVERIVAYAPNGSFGLLPRHVDMVSQLSPGVLSYQTKQGTEHFAAVNGGTLVKCDDQVLVSTRSAILGDDLESLRGQVTQQFVQIDEEERVARSALARLEAGMIRHMMKLDPG